MFRVIRRFLGLVRERRIINFLQKESVLKEIYKHATGSGTVYFFLFKSLPRYLDDKRRKRAVVTAGEVYQQKKTVPSKSPLSNVDWARLCDAYALMRSETPAEPKSPYFVGGLWENWDSVHQPHFVGALLDRDFDTLSYIFKRIGSDEASKGISLSGDQPGNLLESFDRANVINTHLATYARLHPSKQIAHYPADWGHFPGALREEGVLLPSAPRMSHNARTLGALARISAGGGGDGHVLEIGGGFGGVPFHLWRELNFQGRYTILDIPEVLIMAAAFLIGVMPRNTIYLYGDSDEPKSKSINLFPHYKLPEFEAGSVDVIFNSHSLSEMNFSTIREYLSQIERIEPLFFLHMNHEYGSQYEINGVVKAHGIIGSDGLELSKTSFKSLHRCPEILTNDGLYLGAMDYWENLYIRRRSSGEV